MPLPTPDYISQVNYKWDHDTNECAVIASTVTSQTILYWWMTDDTFRSLIHDAVMVYATQNGQTEANAFSGSFPSAGWTTVNYSGTLVGAVSAGLVDQLYTASVNADGVDISISIAGFALGVAKTVDAVLVDINTALGVAATATIVGGDINIVSDTTGLSSKLTVTDVDLFATLTGFIDIANPVEGVDDFNDLLRQIQYKGFPLRSQFMGNLFEVPNKPPTNRNYVLDSQSYYVDASDGVAKFYKDDLPA